MEKKNEPHCSALVATGKKERKTLLLYSMKKQTWRLESLLPLKCGLEFCLSMGPYVYNAKGNKRRAGMIQKALQTKEETNRNVFLVPSGFKAQPKNVSYSSTLNHKVKSCWKICPD